MARRIAAVPRGVAHATQVFAESAEGNSGAEAMENAVKIARHATRRPGVLCFEDGFHGRTLLALSISDDELDEGLEVMTGCLAAVASATAPR